MFRNWQHMYCKQPILGNYDQLLFVYLTKLFQRGYLEATDASLFAEVQCQMLMVDYCKIMAL